MKKNKKEYNDKEQRIKLTKILDDYGVLIVYIIAFLSLIFSVLFKSHYIMIIPIIVFFIYDIWFRWLRKGSWVVYGRDYIGTVESIRMASQYTSFFIAFIAISLSFALENEISSELKELFTNKIIQYFGFVVLSFSGLVLLFIPIPYLMKGNEEKEPSTALKNCFFLVLFMEKTIILLLVYLIIQISLIFIK